MPIPLRLAISDAAAHGWLTPADRQRGLVRWVRHCVQLGADLLQLREKSLEAGELFSLARALLTALPPGSPARLLLNGRPDVALAAGCHGVHLSAAPGELRPHHIRQLFGSRPVFISSSCHNPEDALRAALDGADLLLFGPVFGKQIAGREVTPPVGLDALAEACRRAFPTPVLALGGVTETNLPACRAAGAQGFASIRAFALAPGEA